MFHGHKHDKNVVWLKHLSLMINLKILIIPFPEKKREHDHNAKCLSVDAPPGSCPLCQYPRQKTFKRFRKCWQTHTNRRDQFYTIDHWCGRENNEAYVTIFNIFIDREARGIMYLVASVRLSICLRLSVQLFLRPNLSSQLTGIGTLGHPWVSLNLDNCEN